MYPPIEDGQDVTSLINGVKEGDDVTSLVGSSVPAKKVEAKPNLWERMKKGGVLDSSISKLERTKNAFLGTDKSAQGRTVAGQGLSEIPGTDKAVTKLDDIINPPSENPGYARPFISGVLGGLLKTAGSGFDPRTAGIKDGSSNPETYKAMMRAVDKGLPIDPSPVPIGNIKQGPKNAPLGLPALGESTPNPRTFYQGAAGTTEAGKNYPIDIAPQNPRLGQIDQLPSPGSKGTLPVTVLPRETEGLSNLDPITAADRGTRLGDIRSLDTSSANGMVRSLDKLRNGEPMKMPVKPNEIGDIGIDSEATSKGRWDINTSPTPNISGVENPKTNARSFGLPREPESIGDITGQAKTKPQTLVPDTPKSGVSTGSNKGNKVDTANLSQKDNTNGVPSPGQAVSSAPESTSKGPRSKDINDFRAEVGSVDRTLSSRPETKPIPDVIIRAADQKAKWIATTERQLAEHTSGLSNGELIDLGNIIDKGPRVGDDPLLVERAHAIKEGLDSVHALAKIPTSATGGKLGYIENYLTHIDKLPEDDLKNGIKQIWEYHVGKPFQNLFGGNELAGAGNSVGDFYERGLGNPDSPFRKTRGVSENPIELNPNKVIPAYIESMARLIFDRPAVDTAKELLASVPDKDIYGSPSKIKELAGWYIKNYTRYDAQPGLSKGWNDLTSKLMRTTGRSMLGFSTGLQTLHLARIPANLYPELGEKYLIAGVKALASQNPQKAWTEAASLGLLQNEVRPFAFKTPMERADSILSFMSAADFLDRSIGYHGFKQMFLDQGLSEAEASAQAIAKSKSTSLVVDSARPIKSFNPQGGLAGSAWRLATQFKQVPIKIIEQYIGIAAKAKEDPKTFARMIAGVGLTVAAADAGLHTFHISPKQAAIQMGGAVGTVVQSVYRDLAKGDIVSALKKTALWITPGGMSIERQLRKGLSAFEH